MSYFYTPHCISIYLWIQPYTKSFCSRIFNQNISSPLFNFATITSCLKCRIMISIITGCHKFISKNSCSTISSSPSMRHK
nr:MAG TPA: hypothetical protein [Caudoviricetes sp.]